MYFHPHFTFLDSYSLLTIKLFIKGGYIWLHKTRILTTFLFFVIASCPSAIHSIASQDSRLLQLPNSEGCLILLGLLFFCQEIGLVTFMFFFELLFPYAFSQFPSMFPLLTYSQLLIPLSADYPRHSRRRRSKISIQPIQEKSKISFYDLGTSQDS